MSLNHTLSQENEAINQFNLKLMPLKFNFFTIFAPSK
jgi:hypothetical protein